MLQPVSTVPQTLTGEVLCDGGRLFVALTEPGDRLTLMLSTDRPVAVLDAAAVAALRELLADAAGRMAAGQPQPDAGACARPSGLNYPAEGGRARIAAALCNRPMSNS